MSPCFRHETCCVSGALKVQTDGSGQRLSPANNMARLDPVGELRDLRTAGASATHIGIRTGETDVCEVKRTRRWFVVPAEGRVFGSIGSKTVRRARHA
jgi:hypothetical protein